MEVTSEYLATLPEWIANIIKSNNITEVYGTEIDYVNYLRLKSKACRSNLR